MEDRASTSQHFSLPLVSAWLGGELSYLEKLCLKSMVHVGHHTILYCYNDLRDVPEGVKLRDAAEVLPENDFSCYSNGSYALGSNLFRYRIFSRFPCIWIDTDMFLLKKIPQLAEYVFGWEDQRYINTAILGLPEYCPLLSEINLLLSRKPFFAPWWTTEQVELQETAVQKGAALPLSALPWATIGPKLVTHLAVKHGVSQFARSPEIFYPVHWKDYRLPFIASEQINYKLSDHTIGVHFWNHMLGDLKANPDPESFVAKQCRNFDVSIYAE